MLDIRNPRVWLIGIAALAALGSGHAAISARKRGRGGGVRKATGR